MLQNLIENICFLQILQSISALGNTQGKQYKNQKIITLEINLIGFNNIILILLKIMKVTNSSSPAAIKEALAKFKEKIAHIKQKSVQEKRQLLAYLTIFDKDDGSLNRQFALNQLEQSYKTEIQELKFKLKMAELCNKLQSQFALQPISYVRNATEQEINWIEQEEKYFQITQTTAKKQPPHPSNEPSKEVAHRQAVGEMNNSQSIPRSNSNPNDSIDISSGYSTKQQI